MPPASHGMLVGVRAAWTAWLFTATFRVAGAAYTSSSRRAGPPQMEQEPVSPRKALSSFFLVGRPVALAHLGRNPNSYLGRASASHLDGSRISSSSSQLPSRVVLTSPRRSGPSMSMENGLSAAGKPFDASTVLGAQVQDEVGRTFSLREFLPKSSSSFSLFGIGAKSGVIVFLRHLG